MSSFPARLAKKIGSIGLSRASGAIYEVARNKILHLIYGFDPWHITGTFHARPYKADVVRLCESVPHDCVVEIGVGLGDILGRVHAVKRVGIDREAAVLRAAKYCVNGPVSFAVADFAKPDELITALKTNAVSSVDVLILVNWIHMIEMDVIAQTLSHVSREIPIKHIVMDTIRAGTQGYRFTHSQDDLRRLGNIKKVIAADDVRDLVIVEMKSQ
ncbi:MAG: hypothetical protein EBU00_06805 [Alphaproteobacteria bacterium]|nr:hypothetical protein [Alphaproteobacteria bacterium]